MKIKALLTSAVIVGIGTGSAAIAQDVTLRFSNWLPPTHYIVTEMIQPWMASVEEATEGRVTFEIQPALGAPAAHVDLVATGVADLGFVPHGYTPARFRLTEIGELPFTSDDAVTNSVAYWRTYQKFLLDANEHRGVKLLSFWTTTPSQLFMSDDVDTLAALEGQKVRVTSPTLQKVGEALEVTPITAASSDTYEMMSRGTLDGTFFQSDSVVAFRLTEYIDSQVNVPGGFTHSSQMLIMNPDKWSAISPEDQIAIEALSGEAMSRAFAAVWDAKASEGDQVLAENGVKVTEIGGDELAALQESLAYLRTDWIEAANERGIDGAAAMQYYQDQLEALGDE